MTSDAMIATQAGMKISIAMLVIMTIPIATTNVHAPYTLMITSTTRTLCHTIAKITTLLDTQKVDIRDILPVLREMLRIWRVKSTKSKPNTKKNLPSLRKSAYIVPKSVAMPRKSYTVTTKRNFTISMRRKETQTRSKNQMIANTTGTCITISRHKSMLTVTITGLWAMRMRRKILVMSSHAIILLMKRILFTKNMNMASKENRTMVSIANSIHTKDMIDMVLMMKGSTTTITTAKLILISNMVNIM